MIKNQSSDNQFARSVYLALTVAAITVIYFATLFRKDAYLILGITFILYGLARLAKRMLAGVPVEKLDRIVFYSVIILLLIPLTYLIWLSMVYTNVISA